MSVVARYLNRMFLVRFLVILFGVIGFATVIDLIDVGPELVTAPEGGLVAGLRYFGLRLPIMLSELMPLAALIAGLLAVADLLRHRELVVLWSSGVRPIAILWMLLPAGLGLIATKLLVDDRVVPQAMAELRVWGIGEYRHRPSEGAAGLYYWLRSGNDIVRLSANAISAGKVAELTIFRRGPDGILTERIDAATAADIEGGWRLQDVVRARVADRTVERLPTLDWPGSIDVERIQLLARPPRELGLGQLYEIIEAGGYGLRAPEPYLTWLHQRIAGALVPMFLMMLAFALVRRFSRTASIAPVFMAGVAIGFTLLIASGVTSALGEVGLIRPAVAGWMPPVILGIVVLALAMRDGWRVPRRTHA
jgi:lipopolysaccharide export system permease protein